MNIPPIVKTLLLINVAVYILDVILQATGIPLSFFCGLFYWSSPYFHFWQLFTYMFLHDGLTHIFFNMFALWMFGRIMEQVWGGKRFLIYYLVCGVGAGLVQELGQEFGLIATNAMTVGASGAVYGILLAFGMTFPNERLYIIPIPIPIKAKYFVAFYALFELFLGLNSTGHVAHFAHLGGMLFGLILIFVWRSRAHRRHVGGFSFGKAFAGSQKREAPQQTSQTSHSTDYTYNARKKAERAEIDRILDKIRKGGYGSLTAEEKRTLFDASKK